MNSRSIALTIHLDAIGRDFEENMRIIWMCANRDWFQPKMTKFINIKLKEESMIQVVCMLDCWIKMALIKLKNSSTQTSFTILRKLGVIEMKMDKLKLILFWVDKRQKNYAKEHLPLDMNIPIIRRN